MTSALPVYPSTSFVDMNERAFTLYELNRPTPDSKGLHRYRYVHVVRGDERAEYKVDLGDASNFGDEFEIPGGVEETRRHRWFKWWWWGRPKFWFEHTVGELVDMANELQLRPHLKDRILAERTDLVAGYHDEMDRRERAKTGRKVFGPREAA